MIVDSEGNKVNPSDLAKQLFYLFGATCLDDEFGDVASTSVEVGKMTEREIGLVQHQLEVVRERMAKLLLGK